MHSGSGNHGCEAIIRSTISIINERGVLISSNPNEDKHFGIGRFIKIRGVNLIKKHSLKYVLYRLKRAITRKRNHYYYRYQYDSLFKDRAKIAVSIGGDNYCGYKKEEKLGWLNKELNNRGTKTVLWGCSIEPDLMKNEFIVEDMNHYALITARESITYEALIEAGVNTNIKIYPDPAFILETAKLKLPLKFEEGRTIGMNVSPLIQRLEMVNNITYDNYKQLMKYIVENTENNVVLIPHVVQRNNNDLEMLTQLYNEFKDTGRIVLIGDHNCMELKGFISRCRMFVGARTHATIAAYSTCVPTLAVGYSIKAKGISKDIFGTYENYVLPVQSLQNEYDLIKSFQWLCDHENEIRTHLQNFMPSYIKKAWQAGDEVRNLMETDI